MIECRKIVTRDVIYKGVDLWNKYNTSFHIFPRLVEQNIFFPFTGVNVEGWGVFKEADLIAFAITKHLTAPISKKYDLDQGWISLLVISKENTDISTTGDKLFKEVERDFKKNGVKKIYFGGDPQNFLPGLPSNLENDYLFLFEKAGYRRQGIVNDLYQDISMFNIPKKISDEILQKKLELKLYVEKVTKKTELFLLRFLKRYFPERWYFEAENIRHIPGGIEDYWVLRSDDNLSGFARTNTFKSSYLGSNINWCYRWKENSCGLGPIGIADDYRGKGFGIYLMINIIQYFKQEGYRHMIIDWTDLVDYYKKIGFKPWIKYTMLEKEL